MNKKVLLTAGHSRRAFKWGMVGEIAKKVLDEGDELYYLDCAYTTKCFCGTQAKPYPLYGLRCRNNCIKMIKIAGIKDENILKMKKYKTPEFPVFDNTLDAVHYEYEGYNIGLGATSCIMTITRDYAFDTKKWGKVLKKYLNTEFQVLKNIEEFHLQYHFDEIHTFNGRMPFNHPAVLFAEKYNIPYFIYEMGSTRDKIGVWENDVPHNLDCLKRQVREAWQNAPADKNEVGKQWFEEKRKGISRVFESFTKSQNQNSLPKDFDENKENIVFFNSSIDEVYAFDSWKHPFADNENEIIENILEHYKDDKNKHFYVRVHPNLARAKKKRATQLVQIEKLNKKYDNLTVIEPEEKIDTYALMKAASKVVTAYSTTACEATYWGTVSILAGKAPYDELDCVYIANSMDELYQLIDDKNLQPKPKENTYPYGYFNLTRGIPLKYFVQNSFSDGSFCGEVLHSK